MFKRLIKKLYFKAYPDKADIDRDELRALEYENRDLNAEVRRLRDELNPYFQSNCLRIQLKPVCIMAEAVYPAYELKSIDDVTKIEEFIKKDLARKFEPEINKRITLKREQNSIGFTYRAYLKFYEEA